MWNADRMSAVLFFVVLALVSVHALYWIIRLAVRHGVQDASAMKAGRDMPQPAVRHDLG